VGNELNEPLNQDVQVSHRKAIYITAFSFVFISLALLILKETPVNGYEASIYLGTPWIVWVALIFGVINGGLLFYRCYGSNTKLWVIGLFEVLLCNIILINIYVLRGFIFLTRGDTLSYIGYAKDIILFNSIPDYNFYPLHSLLVSSTSMITNYPVTMSTLLFPAFFLIIYFVSIFAWSKSISREREFITAMLFASLPIFFAWFVHSVFYETLSVMMIPLFLYSLQKGRSGDIRFITLSFALVIFFALSHPLVALFLLLFLIIFFVIERLAKSQQTTVSISLVLFAGVIFLGWVATQASLVRTISITIDQLIGLIQYPKAVDIFEASSSKIGLLDTIISVLACIIDDIIFMILAIWAAVVIWKNTWRKGPIGLYFAGFIGGMVFLVALIVMTSLHNPYRFVNLNFNMILTIPLVGFLLYQKRKLGKMKTARFVIFSHYSSYHSFNPLYLSRPDSIPSEWNNAHFRGVRRQLVHKYERYQRNYVSFGDPTSKIR
jgi:hypothetical protein